MPTTRRTSVYLDPDLHRALRIKAAQTERTLSELANEAIRSSLEEDLEDLAAFEERRDEPSRPLEKVLADLKRRGKL